MKVDYYRLNQVVNSVAGAVPDVVSLFEQIKIMLDTLYTAIVLTNDFFPPLLPI